MSEPAPESRPRGSAGPVAGIHPDRVISGRHPDRGLVLAGVVTACRPAGALWEIAIRIADATATARLPEAAPAGRRLVLTAVDPPCFGPDGVAADVGGPAWGDRRAMTGRAGAQR